MTTRSDSAIRLDDTLLDSVTGGGDAPPPPRVMPVAGNGPLFDKDNMGSLNREVDKARYETRNYVDGVLHELFRWKGGL